MVTLGWILGKPLTLLFDPFESIVLFLAGTPSSQPTEVVHPDSVFDSTYRKLRRPRWQVELARGYDPYVYVYSLLHPLRLC